MQNTNNNNRKLNIDLLRIFACFFVVLSHTSSDRALNTNLLSLQGAIPHLLNSVGHTGTILFFFISGSLLLSSEYNFKPGKFYKNNFLRLLIAYCGWVIIYHVVGLLQRGIYTPAHLKEVALSIIRGEAGYHFWYLPMLLGIYLLLPFLRAICHSNKWILTYFVALFLVIQIGFTTLCFFEFPYKYLIMSLMNRLPLTLVNHHVGYFVLGYFLSVLLSEHRITNPRLWGWVLTIAGPVFGLLGDIVITMQQGAHGVTFNTLFSATMCMTATGIFLLFSSLQADFSKWYTPILKVSGLTFGIYMLHPMILNGLSALCPQFFLNPGTIGILIMTLLSFLISALLTRLLCMIPLIRKWIFFA